MRNLIINASLVCVASLAIMIGLEMWHLSAAKPTLVIGGTTHTLNSPMEPYTVLGSPTISPSRIDQILCTAHSPACGTGQALFTDGVKYGIDPVYALAFFHHESSYGLYGVARSSRSLGNIRCTPGYKCIDGYRAYSTWQEGYSDWYQLILYYVTQWHKATLSTIIPTYAPSSENDVQAYLEAVENDVREWRS